MLDIHNPAMAAIVLVLLIIGFALIKIFWAIFTALKKNLGIEIITLYISTNILWEYDDLKYYNAMKNL